MPSRHHSLPASPAHSSPRRRSPPCGEGCAEGEERVAARERVREGEEGGEERERRRRRRREERDRQRRGRGEE